MKVKKSLIFSIITIITILLSLSDVQSHEEDRIIRLKELDLSADETYIPIKSGQNFVIELEGNITTGYSWFLGTPEKLQESNLLRPINLKENHSGDYYSIGDTKKNDQEIKRLGAGGIFHFKFLAGEKTGHEKLTFIYKRPWSEEGKIEKSVNVKVVNLKDNNDL